MQEQLEADAEAAKRLQADFDSEGTKPKKEKDFRKVEKKSDSKSVLSSLQECPVCHLTMTVEVLDGHVDECLAKEAKKEGDKTTDKPGLFTRLFKKDSQTTGLHDLSKQPPQNSLPTPIKQTVQPSKLLPSPVPTTSLSDKKMDSPVVYQPYSPNQPFYPNMQLVYRNPQNPTQTPNPTQTQTPNQMQYQPQYVINPQTGMPMQMYYYPTQTQPPQYQQNPNPSTTIQK